MTQLVVPGIYFHLIGNLILICAACQLRDKRIAYSNLLRRILFSVSDRLFRNLSIYVWWRLDVQREHLLLNYGFWWDFLTFGSSSVTPTVRYRPDITRALEVRTSCLQYTLTNHVFVLLIRLRAELKSQLNLADTIPLLK